MQSDDNEQPKVIGTEDAGLDVPLNYRDLQGESDAKIDADFDKGSAYDFQKEIMGETLELTAEVPENLVTAAEAFGRIFNSVYDAVMYQTRDHAKATDAAEQAWLLFVEFLESKPSDGETTSA
jgi:hypothetical protein